MQQISTQKHSVLFRTRQITLQKVLSVKRFIRNRISKLSITRHAVYAEAVVSKHKKKYQRDKGTFAMS